MQKDIEVRIQLDTLVVKRPRSSVVQTAKILGGVVDDKGNFKKIWLDRLIHKPNEDRLGEWRCYGAVTTILEKT